MRKLILAFAAVAALAVAGPAGAATKAINIYGSTFSPKSATITEGDTVTWVNRDNANHQIFADKGQFASAILHPKQTFSFTFRAAGTYTYADELHPKIRGTITVKGLPPTLTFAASAPIVTYGTQATLSGVVSNHRAGEQVTIYYQPYPQPNLIQRATLLTTTGGAFTFIVEPQILTTYEATWKGAYATPTSIEVTPKLDARAQQRLDHPRIRRPLIRRSCRAVPAAQPRDGAVGDPEEAVAELEVLGPRALPPAEGHEPSAGDALGQPGRRRVPRCDQHHGRLQAARLTDAAKRRAEGSAPARCFVAASRLRPS